MRVDNLGHEHVAASVSGDVPYPFTRFLPVSQRETHEEFCFSRLNRPITSDHVTVDSSSVECRPSVFGGVRTLHHDEHGAASLEDTTNHTLVKEVIFIDKKPFHPFVCAYSTGPACRKVFSTTGGGVLRFDITFNLVFHDSNPQVGGGAAHRCFP